MTDNNNLNISIDDIGKRWGALLNQAFVTIEKLEKRNKMLEEAIRHLSAELEALKNQKPIID